MQARNVGERCRCHAHSGSSNDSCLVRVRGGTTVRCFVIGCDLATERQLVEQVQLVGLHRRGSFSTLRLAAIAVTVAAVDVSLPHAHHRLRHRLCLSLTRERFDDREAASMSRVMCK
jgi:hypothetical protein